MKYIYGNFQVFVDFFTQSLQTEYRSKGIIVQVSIEIILPQQN